MTVDAELVDMLDEKRAKALDKRIRNLVDGAPVSWLVSLNGLIAEAQSGQIHLALGFPRGRRISPMLSPDSNTSPQSASRS